MDKIDFSYMNHPPRSKERIIGRRVQANLLAERITGRTRIMQSEYSNAYMKLALLEAERGAK